MTREEFNRHALHEYDHIITENTERFGQEDQADDACFIFEMEIS